MKKTFIFFTIIMFTGWVLAFPADLNQSRQNDVSGTSIIQPDNTREIVQVAPLAVAYWTGTCTNAAFTDDSEVRGHDAEDGWMMFDISAIPIGATILEIEFHGYVNSTYYPYWEINGVYMDPLTATPADLFAAISNSTNQYNYFPEPSTFPTGWKVDILGNAANADMQVATTQGWFCIGINSTDNSATFYINFDGWNEANLPFLIVTYEGGGGPLGNLTGVVNEIGTGTPIEGAVITIGGTNLSATSQTDGSYSIVNILPNIYDISCAASLYFTIEELEFDIVEGPNTLNFDLPWSEIETDVTELTCNIPPDEIEIQTFNISNAGPGDLEYYISFDFSPEDRVINEQRFYPFSNQRENLNSSKYTEIRRNASDICMEYPFIGPNSKASHNNQGISPTDDLMDWQFEWPVGGAIGEAGVETDGNYVYTTNWDGNAFYKYGMDGTYIEEFSVAGCSGSIRDLAYDGQYFYGSDATNTVYEMDFDTQTTISTINAPTAVRAIAYDAVNDGFWANNWSDSITLFDRNGNFLDSFPCGQFQYYYGFAWEDVLPSGPYLWGYSQDDNTLVQIDLATGLETGVNYDIMSIFNNAVGLAGGLCISSAFVPGKWTICGMSQNSVIWGGELADFVSWVMVTNNISGTVPANGGTIEVEVTFDTTDLLIGDVLTADLLIHNNSNYTATRGDDYVIPVSLTVTGFIPPSNLFVDVNTWLFTWDAPPGPNLLGYNVFLDDMGTPIGTTTTTEWQYEDLVAGQAYVAGVSAVYDDGESQIMEYQFTAVNAGNTINLITELHGNFPNPFNPDTQIAFSLSKQSHVQITVYNIKGQLVRTLVDEECDADNYTVTWNGADNNSKTASSGVYFYKMKTDNFLSTKKMILMK